jgi:membrane fusion protein (multidrug efflux system)
MESHETNSHETPVPQNLPRVHRGTLTALVSGIALLFLVAFIARWIPERAHERQLRQQADELADAPPTVKVETPQPQGVENDLVLPGDARSMAQTAIFARVDGYIGRWLVDIGDHVDKDQLLATIEAPDTDAQLNNARAALQQAKANVVKAEADLELATATYERYHGLLASGSVTQQDLDTRLSAENQTAATKAAADAAVKSAEALVQQLEAQQGFEKIIAPYSGTITFRNYDIGARIAATDTAAGHELYDIEDTDRLRIWVDVPQPYVTLIQINQPVDFFSPRNYATRHFVGYVARTAGSLNPATRTLHTELDFDNKDHALWAGMYGQVHIAVHQPHPILTVPTAALLFEADGTLLAIVDENNRVHFKKVSVGQDLGQRLEVLGGISPDDHIITNPGEKLVDGGVVQLATQPAPAPSAVANADPPTTRVAQTDVDPPGGSH